MKKAQLIMATIASLLLIILLTVVLAKINSSYQAKSKDIQALKSKLAKVNNSSLQLSQEIKSFKLKVEKLKKAQKRTEKSKTIKNIGFFNRIYQAKGQTLIDFNEVEFYSGQEAVKAAIEDGLISSPKELGSDFYVRDPDKKIRTLTVHPAAKVYLATYNAGSLWDPQIKKGFYSLSKLVKIFQAKDPANEVLINDLFWIEIQDDWVVKITEQPLVDVCST